jgi:hypothetical protein
MIRLLGWGGEAASTRATSRGFVPQLETLDGRVMPSVTVAGIKGEFTLASGPGVAAQQRIEAPAPADQYSLNVATAPVHLPGSGEAGFVSVAGTWGEGKTVKIDFCVADPGVAAQVSTVAPAPAVGLVATPAGPDGANSATAPVHVHGSGDSDFHRDGRTWFEPAKTDKDKFEPHYA